MTMTFQNIPACTIAYIRSVGPYGGGSAQAMDALKGWADAHGLLGDDAVILGIAWDDPAATRPENCRYDACLVVAEDAICGGPVCPGRLAGGRYAVFAIAHTAQAVAQAWEDIIPALSQQHCEADFTRPVLERYRAEMIRAHQCEICVPIL